MKIIVITVLLLAELAGSSQAQKNLDSLLHALQNKDLYVAPIIRGVDITVRKRTDHDSLAASRKLFVVSSLDEDIQLLAGRYSKQVLVPKLYALLEDTTRDLYASALLYDLLDNQKLGKLFAMSREKWVSSGKRASDIGYWTAYMKK